MRTTGKLARVLAHLPDPGFSEENYQAFERKLSRKIELSKRGPLSSLDMGAKWRPSADYLELIGLDGIVGADSVFEDDDASALGHDAAPLASKFGVSEEIASLIDPDFDSSFDG